MPSLTSVSMILAALVGLVLVSVHTNLFLVATAFSQAYDTGTWAFHFFITNNGAADACCANSIYNV